MTMTVEVESPGVADLEDKESLFNTLYEELHRLARREVFRRGRMGGLGVTTVLHEAYLSISRTEGASFAYTWHGAPGARSFGRGCVYVGSVVGGTPPDGSPVPRYTRLTAGSRARLPFGLWNRASSRALGAGFAALERSRAGRREQPLFDALFPFARRGEYLLLYGRRGLAEHQSLVPHAAAADFLAALEREVLAAQAPIVMGSLKLFRGEPRFVRFEGDGVCVTLDLVRSAAGLAFMDRLDRLMLEFGGLPHLVKDSRIAAPVAARCYPGYEEFRERRRAYDPDGRFRSAHQKRLGL